MSIFVQWKPEQEWTLHLEDGSLDRHTYFGQEEEKRPYRVVIIQHPPIHAYSDYAAYKAVTAEETDVEYFRTTPGDSKNTILKKGQKKTITAGIERMHQEDYAIWAALSTEVNLQKVMLMITHLKHILRKKAMKSVSCLRAEHQRNPESDW